MNENSFPSRPAEMSGDNVSYTKFLLYSHARSGSSLFIRLLSTHSNIETFGELFVKGRIGFLNKASIENDKRLIYLRNKYPSNFLAKYIYTGYRDHIKAVGFKLFPDQIDDLGRPEFWDWVEKQRDIKIIHLHRSNLLATYCSLMMARKTGTFGITDASDRAKITLHIDVKHCEKEFKKRVKHHQFGRKLFKHHDQLHIDYSDLDTDLAATMQNVQQFLGLPLQDLTTSKVKQEVRPLNQVIENYSEVKAYFASGEFAYLFED